jgi:hypothetical protein
VVIAASRNLSFEAAMCFRRSSGVLREFERITQERLKLSIKRRFADPGADQGLEIIDIDGPPRVSQPPIAKFGRCGLM